MTEEQRAALGKLMDIGDALGVIITHHKSTGQKLELPDAAVAKLSEARQAVFAAQRLIEQPPRQRWEDIAAGNAI